MLFRHREELFAAKPRLHTRVELRVVQRQARKIFRVGDRIAQIEAIERRALEFGAAQIDRELAPYRIAGRKRRIASSALATMQREVAVRCEPYGCAFVVRTRTEATEGSRPIVAVPLSTRRERRTASPPLAAPAPVGQLSAWAGET